MKKQISKIKYLVIILLVIVFLFTSIKIIIFFKDLNNNKKEHQSLIEDVVQIIPSEEIDNSEQSEKYIIDFEKLLAINADTVGWIQFNDNKVNNPIVQAMDNEYYLNRSFEGSKNQVGTIFMDYRNISFDDQNVVLFGHSIWDDSMFGSVKDVFKDGFFDIKDNNYIYINDLNNNILTYQIFSCYIIEKEEYYITPSFADEWSFLTFINTISGRSYREFNVEVTVNDNILTLSTCAGTGDTSKRIVVHAKRINN